MRSSSWHLAGSRLTAAHSARRRSLSTNCSSGAEADEQGLVDRLLAAAGVADPPGLAAGDGDQPADQRVRGTDVVEAAQQAEPGGLHDVFARRPVEPLGAGHVPQHRAQLGDDVVEGAVPLGARVIEQAREAFAAAVAVLPGDRALGYRRQLAVHHATDHLMRWRAVLIRAIVVSRSTASRLNDAFSAAPVNRPAAAYAATSGAANEVPLHTANPLRKLSGSKVRRRLGGWFPTESATAGVRLPLTSVGKVLTMAAPVAKQRTHDPSLL